MSDSREDYYLIGMIDYLQTEQFARFAKNEFVDFCAGYILGDVKISKGLSALDAAMETLCDLGVLEELADDFAGSHYIVVGPDGITKIEERLASSRAYDIYLRMADDRGDWLGRAFDGIERSKAPVPPEKQDEDVWQPLQIDIDGVAGQSAIEGAQQAITAIKADNGFASAHPAIRDNIVTHAESTVAAAKNGAVTKNQIRQNLIRAGRWLSEKFAGSTLGGLGSELAKWGLRMLGLIP